MEAWLPLFDIFLNSPTPETEASLWLQQSFTLSYSSSSTTTPPITTASFLSLLTKPHDFHVLSNSVSPNPPSTKRVMFMQTLPDIVQSRILSFLAFERQRFCKRNLVRLAKDILREESGTDFWVEKAARNLFDVLSDSDFKWISDLSLDSGSEGVNEDFHSVPDWLKVTASNSEMVLHWLPISVDELDPRASFATGHDEPLVSRVAENEKEDEELEWEIEIETTQTAVDADLSPEIQTMAARLREQVMVFESSAKTVKLANEIRQICLCKQEKAVAILCLIEPWRADDETVSVLISHLLEGDKEEELGWPSIVLCSLLLPKLLGLEKPISRILLTSTLDYCKLHQKAAVYALLFPLLMKKDGINNHICEVIVKIASECLHTVHVSAFIQNLLCGEESEGKMKIVCLPCHHCLLSHELVWTESLFNLFYNILKQNVHLTQDSVDQLVFGACKVAERFCRSLKFGNLLLCLVTKCGGSLKSHKMVLMEAVTQTDSLVTKSILSKLASL